MSGNIVSVVQARMGSNRLPNKSMLFLHGHPIIEWVLHRASKAKKIGQLIFAIPSTPENDVLSCYLTMRGAQVYRGSESDVLSRVFCACRDLNPEYILHICADNPLISWTEIDNLVEYFMENKCDYAYNHFPLNNNYADGFGAAIAPFEILRKLHEEAKLPEHREHVFKFVLDQPEIFNIKTFDPPDSRLRHPELRVDLDTYQDYEYLLKLNIDIDVEPFQVIKVSQGIDRP